VSLELNKIHLGDSYELIKQIPDKSVDLVVIDPPYEILTEGGGGSFGSKQRQYHSEYTNLNGDNFKKEGKRIMANVMKMGSNVKNLASGFDYSLLNELDRVLKKINIYIWCNKNQLGTLISHYEKKGCNIDLLTWHKTNPLPTTKNKYLSDTEYCVFARDIGVNLYGSMETKKKYYVSPANIDDKHKYDHPTIKPLQIVKNLIINSSNENDVVLDCFMGSGTTAVASKELNRQYIGIEIDEKWHKIAVDRVNGINARGEISLFADFDKIEIIK
jgi:DNA modification methylase